MTGNRALHLHEAGTSTMRLRTWKLALSCCAAASSSCSTTAATSGVPRNTSRFLLPPLLLPLSPAAATAAAAAAAAALAVCSCCLLPASRLQQACSWRCALRHSTWRIVLPCSQQRRSAVRKRMGSAVPRGAASHHVCCNHSLKQQSMRCAATNAPPLCGSCPFCVRCDVSVTTLGGRAKAFRASTAPRPPEHAGDVTTYSAAQR